MNREETIRTAREAGIGWGEGIGGMADFLERFAALVEQNFKRRLADSIEQLPFGDTAQSFATYVREFK